ncbi:MAG: fibronectin type III domain-containing protein [Bacteroidales bacterium]|nr:fibronectin type III domain-containing protein [Bacteroidales bacterium]MCF8404270.1 fibronectin type III domain-containing protein [Bacteroidales bacterium]
MKSHRIIVMLISLAIAGVTYGQASFEPACVAAEDVLFIEASANAATFSWLAPGLGSSWHIEIGKIGFEPGQAQFTRKYYFRQLEQGNTCTFTAEGLKADTPYMIYVRSSCGMYNFSDWSTPVMFQTARY